MSVGSSGNQVFEVLDSMSHVADKSVGELKANVDFVSKMLRIGKRKIAKI